MFISFWLATIVYVISNNMYANLSGTLIWDPAGKNMCGNSIWVTSVVFTSQPIKKNKEKGIFLNSN